MNRRCTARAVLALVFIALRPGFCDGKDLDAFLAGLPVTQRAEVYKTAGDSALTMHIFEPSTRKQGEKLPAIVFFFGGGWVGGTPKQFFPHCRYLASRGMVAMAAEYRVKNRHGTPPAACVRDGKSAVRWIRVNAGKLGVDPDLVAAGGGSAGGHVAACTALVEGFEEQGENTAVSSTPVALVLFNPVTSTAEGRFTERFGDDAGALSPDLHVRAGLPPTIIFHGEEDTVAPYADIVRFTKLMKEAGNRCELVAFEGMQHGFFNYGRFDNVPFVETVRAMDRFLGSLGFLSGEPTL